MKVSRTWLQRYFDAALPDVEVLAEAFTSHAFEIEEGAGDLLDVKVLPDRAGYALSHRGVAYELSAILNIPLRRDPLRESVPAFVNSGGLIVEADDAYVNRHTGTVVQGVTVGPSPEWLKIALESVGQRSINNVVDAMNYVMLDIGQPSGAFDLSVITPENGTHRILVRRAKEGEKIQVLTGETYDLTENMWVFADAVSGAILDVAGIKGGLASGVTEKTKDIFITVGNYDGTRLRRVAQKLKLFTDASTRFQNRPSPELTVYGMRDLLALIQEVAGGEVVAVHDTYLKKPERRSIRTSGDEIAKCLGVSYSNTEIEDIFRRLGLSFEKQGDSFMVTPPFERTDIVIREDLAEEVGRIAGYDKIEAAELPQNGAIPDQSRFRGIERMKDQLVEKGFIEVSTQSFVKKGDVTLANPLDKTRPALRKNLEETLNDALLRAKNYAPLTLPPREEPKLFEVGNVFPKEGEYTELRMTERVPEWGDAAGTVDNLSIAKLEEYGKDYMPRRYTLSPYKPFSVYPFIVRDVALWVPEGTLIAEVSEAIQSSAGHLLIRLEQFDTFSKERRTSYAFRLVFQAFDRTLTDQEVNGWMEKVTAGLTKKSWEVR
jgi:phenylalanyl-tRNA synthetase beta chain